MGDSDTNVKNESWKWWVIGICVFLLIVGIIVGVYFLLNQKCNCGSGKKCNTNGGCVDCLANSDCSNGKKCNTNGGCVDCLANSDCLANQVCTNGSCVSNQLPTNKCSTNADCSGKKCSSTGSCVDCLTNTDCLANQECKNGSCVNKCDCGSRKCSSTGSCVDCLVDGDCSENKKCSSNGTCVTCITDSQCSAGQKCSKIGTCGVCSTEKDCGGNKCTDNGVCITDFNPNDLYTICGSSDNSYCVQGNGGVQQYKNFIYNGYKQTNDIITNGRYKIQPVNGKLNVYTICSEIGGMCMYFNDTIKHDDYRVYYDTPGAQFKIQPILSGNNLYTICSIDEKVCLQYDNGQVIMLGDKITNEKLPNGTFKIEKVVNKLTDTFDTTREYTICTSGTEPPGKESTPNSCFNVKGGNEPSNDIILFSDQKDSEKIDNARFSIRKNGTGYNICINNTTPDLCLFGWDDKINNNLNKITLNTTDDPGGTPDDYKFNITPVPNQDFYTICSTNQGDLCMNAYGGNTKPYDSIVYFSDKAYNQTVKNGKYFIKPVN
jgi:hypothetical protein